LKVPVITEWMGKLKTTMNTYHFPPEHILNFDETMLDASGHHVKVLVCAHDPCPFTENEVKLEHISLGFCISAVERYVHPLYILPLKNLLHLEEQVKSFYSFTEQRNGFIMKFGMNGLKQY
jgi:hypothetical protein